MKTSMLLFILVAVAIVVAYLIFSKPAYPLTEQDAKKFFLEDLEEKYPNADVREVVEILPMVAADGSSYFQLKALVVLGFHTPCPERINVYYDYPVKNFVAQPPEHITKDCRICINDPVICIIAFPEEAIIASHTYENTQEVAKFIKENKDAVPTFDFLETYNNNTGVWKVEWYSNSANKTYSVFLSKSENRVLEVFSK